MKNWVLLSVFIISITSFAQVGVNTTTPNAQLEIKSSNEAAPANTDGILIPKVDLFPAINPTALQQGMMVYLTTISGANQPGFYFWDNISVSWKSISSTNGWSLNGNSGTNSTNFIGTNDAQPLLIRVNGIPSGIIDYVNSGSTGFGYNALSTSSNGGSFNNTAFGYNALIGTTPSFDNTAVGYKTLTKTIPTSYRNTAVGSEALSINLSSGNTAIGAGALTLNTFGFDNVGIGPAALFTNTTGNENIAIGLAANRDNSVGNRNIAIGLGTNGGNTTGNENIGIGKSANAICKNGERSTCIGTFSMSYMKLTSATNYINNNVTVGYQALRGDEVNYFANIDNPGLQNTAIGYQSILNISSGNRNTAIGINTLNGTSSGNFNTAIGSYAFQTGNFSNSSAIGDACSISASNQVRIGDSSVSSIGGFANWTNVSDKRFKKDIKQNVPGLEFIKKLQPVTYYLDMDAIAVFYKTPDSLRKKDSEAQKGKILQTGFIAQEVEAAAKELNYDFSGVDAPKNENDFYGLRYAEFVVPLVKAVQELEEKNQELKSEIEKMKKDIEFLLKHNNTKNKE